MTTPIIQSKGKFLSSVNNKKLKDIEWEAKSNGDKWEVDVKENGKKNKLLTNNTKKIIKILSTPCNDEIPICNESFDSLAGLDHLLQQPNITLKIEEKPLKHNQLTLGSIILNELSKSNNHKDFMTEPKYDDLENIVITPKNYYSNHQKILSYNPSKTQKSTDIGKKRKFIIKNKTFKYSPKLIEKKKKQNISNTVKTKIEKNQKSNHINNNTRKNK